MAPQKTVAAMDGGRGPAGAAPGRGGAGWRRGLERPDGFYVDEAGASAERAGGGAARSRGAGELVDAARLLRLPRRVAAAGQVLLQRFLCKPAAAETGVDAAWRTALWIASKADPLCVAADQRPLQDFLQVFWRMEGRHAQFPTPVGGEPASPAPPPLLLWDNPNLPRWRAEVVRTEKVMLRELGFAVGVELPYRILFFLLSDRFLGASPKLRQEALNVANDSLRTTLPVRFRAPVLACGAIFLAARLLREPLPEAPVPWWDVAGVPLEDILDMCQTMLQYYAEEEARAEKHAARAGNAGKAEAAKTSREGGGASGSGERGGREDRTHEEGRKQIHDDRGGGSGDRDGVSRGERDRCPGAGDDERSLVHHGYHEKDWRDEGYSRRGTARKYRRDPDREDYRGGHECDRDYRRGRGGNRDPDRARDRDLCGDRDWEYRRDRDRDRESRRDRDRESRRDRDRESRRDRHRHREYSRDRDRDRENRRDRDRDYIGLRGHGRR